MDSAKPDIILEDNRPRKEGVSAITGLRNFGQAIINCFLFIMNATAKLFHKSKNNSVNHENHACVTDSLKEEQFVTIPNEIISEDNKSPTAPSSIASKLTVEPITGVVSFPVTAGNVPISSSEPTALPEPAADETKNTLVIKNLPFKFKQQELDDLLNAHQAKAKNVRMMRDNQGRFTGIAFIRCNSKEEAGRLIISMNNLEIGGRNIQVEFKKKKKKTKNNQEEESDSEISTASSSLRNSVDYCLEEVPLQQQNENESVSKLRRPSLPIIEYSKPKVDLRKSGPVFNEMKPASIKRRSSVTSDSILNSRNFKMNLPLKSAIVPIRQPFGPNGKSNGFQQDYICTRHCN